MKRIQDSVHGLMEFRGMECAAVDLLRAPEIQRLRRIRQLGLVSLVFPGAEHSRFTHSLGAAHVMKRFANALVAASASYLPRSLQPDERVVRDLILAALCHDLGHGPLSHAWENNVVGRDFDREQWRRKLGISEEMEASHPWLSEGEWNWHEIVTQAVLLSKTEIHSMLESIEEGTAARVAALLADHFHLPYLAGAFASDVDADRCDFILRDATQSGVSHGRFDLDWLVSTIAVGAADGRPVLGFDKEKAPRVIEQLLVARRALYDIVYRHPAVRAAEGMVGLMLKQARDGAKGGQTLPTEPEFTAFSHAIKGTALSLDEVGALDDDALAIFLRRLARSVDKDAPLARIAAMLQRRELFKPLRLPPADLAQLTLEPAPHGEALNRIDAVLKSCGYDPPDQFRFLDRSTFKFFHEGPPGEGSWLIDQSKAGRPARAVRREESLVHHQEKRESVWLFVPRDAALVING